MVFSSISAPLQGAICCFSLQCVLLRRSRWPCFCTALITCICLQVAWRSDCLKITFSVVFLLHCVLKMFFCCRLGSMETWNNSSNLQWFLWTLNMCQYSSSNCIIVQYTLHSGTAHYNALLKIHCIPKYILLQNTVFLLIVSLWYYFFNPPKQRCF